MLEDINTGVAWVLRHIGRHGGDPENVYLCGQSAGGHLLALVLLAQVSFGNVTILGEYYYSIHHSNILL